MNIVGGPVLQTLRRTLLRRSRRTLKSIIRQSQASPHPRSEPEFRPAQKSAHDYLTRYYAGVPGFSSLLAAQVAATLLTAQTAAGVTGGIGEIGVYKGRSFIGLALHAAPGEPCLAIDDFSEGENLQAAFTRNCETYGVEPSSLTTLRANTLDLTPAAILRHTEGTKLRYLHVDGGHDTGTLSHDLTLAAAVTAPDGIICLDDMLHPMYPELPAITGQFLAAQPEWRVFCITDRADLFASKYFLCHPDRIHDNQMILRAPFAKILVSKPAAFAGSNAIILSQDLALAPYYEALMSL
jgi:hypothetical protein